MPVGEIKCVAVVGSGFMGHGIGQEAAVAGFEVVLYDKSEAQLDLALQRIEQSLDQLAGLGIVAQGDVEDSLGRIETTTTLGEAVADADLVIEAVYEDLDLKQQVFRELDQVCPERTILASNTSTFLPSLLASATKRPDRVLVTHYFYPPALLPLVEIVCGPSTAEETVGVVRDFVCETGKSPIVLQKEAFGFVANRLQFALQREALFIVEQGIASAQDVDIAVKDGFGRRLAVAGPFEIAEPIGWDLELRIQEVLFPHLAASAAPSPSVEGKVERGELGVKTGRGFYDWTGESAAEWGYRMSSTLAHFAAWRKETSR